MSPKMKQVDKKGNKTANSINSPNKSLREERIPDTSYAGEIATLVSALIGPKLEEIHIRLNIILEELKSQAERIKEMEQRISNCEDTQIKVQLQMEALLKQNISLSNKIDEMENRSRRSNLRLIGIPESLRPQDLKKFVERTIPELLGLNPEENIFTTERVHRMGRERDHSTTTDRRPRPVMAKFLNFQGKSEILRAYRKQQNLYHQGAKILLFQDFSTEVSLKRKQFSPICSRLVAEKRFFSLLYPARLRIKSGMDFLFFDSPEAALSFVITRVGMNQSDITHFVLSGFSELSDKQLMLAILFLIFYLIALTGNVIIILLVKFDSNLHNPMYFFLGNLSFIDICFISTTLPKLLVNHLFGSNSISLHGCIMQMYFFFFIGNTESLLMAVMALDRYVAICRPLHYTVVMSWKTCYMLLISCWATSSLHSLIYSLMTSRLSFCGSNIVRHFFCDIPPILQITCSDTFVYQLVLYTEGSLMVGGPFIVILMSYVYIFISILGVSSLVHRRKLFSTCSSHLAVVSLFYGTDLFTYMRPSLSPTSLYNQIVSVMYTAITPMLNPFIYSLRNNDVMQAFKRLMGRK
ncbi:olfactory receptor 1361-like [Bombina bombina]|uniref:olfactory receptor 1361-like n=1 Tax=Bombina bombina TaxID=8345 RepID=UPI00235ABFC3|nr:olfactory receptor 1361-like [Bombina bombina]